MSKDQLKSYFLDLEKIIKGFEMLFCKNSVAHCENVVYKLMSHLLDNQVRDMDRFGSLRAVNSFPVERRNVHIEPDYISATKRQCSEMNRR